MLRLVAPHAREQGLHLRCVFGHGESLVVSDDITTFFLVFHIDGLAVDTFGNGCVVIGSIKQRPRTVLLTVKIGEHRKGVLGFIFINRCIRVGADHQHEERRITNQDEHERKNSDVADDFFAFGSEHDPPYDETNQQGEIDDGSQVERGSKAVYEKQLELAGEVYNLGDEEHIEQP